MGIFAEMNLTQFVTALYKLVLASVAMKGCAKWTYVRDITLLFKTNLASLKEVSSQKMPAQTGDRLACWTGHVVIIAWLVSHFLQHRTLKGEWLGKEIVFSHLPLSSAKGQQG